MIEYKYMLGAMAPPELIKECSILYSEHYGLWSSKSPISPGARIRLSPDRIREWLTGDADLYLAYTNNTLMGYAIAIKLKVPKYGVISLVTQLVVHEEFRKNDIAKTLLFSIWRFSNHFAWGIVTPNPFAIRALEKATRRRCFPFRIAKNRRKLVNLCVDKAPYIDNNVQVEINRETSMANTNFFVDHSTLDTMIKSVSSAEKPWLLGQLEEGWEWFAFTFNDQTQISLTPQEIEKMMEASDQVTKKAYSRMLVDSGHRWAQHTEKEAAQIIEYCKLKPGHTVLDLGCGNGRHSIALAKKGIVVTGVDYSKEFIDRANVEGAKLQSYRPRFIEDDCRNLKLEQKFDAVICLYDVVGTYAKKSENHNILNNIAIHLKPDGLALISVMNFELTQKLAKHFFSLEKEPDKLLTLPASSIMEQTGNVFDPNYYMIDTDTTIVYRKEQFAAGHSLPEELIIRDRRFIKNEIEEMCKVAGLDVLCSRFVSAGRWDSSLDRHNSAAKEILLLCKKRV